MGVHRRPGTREHPPQPGLVTLLEGCSLSGHRRLAVLALAAAPLLPLAAVLQASPSAANDRTVLATAPAARHSGPTARQIHLAHLTHLHHLHVLHLSALANLRGRAAAHGNLHASVRARVVAAAKRYEGQPYSYGGLDCSGLTQRAYGAVGKKLPRSAAQQQGVARHVRSPLPGDLVFYGYPAYHVAIYIRKGWMVAARHTGTVVQEQRIWGSPTYGTVLT